MKKLLIFVALISLNLFAQNGITWTEVTANYPTLPEGVKLYHGTRTTPALNAFYVDVDLNNSKIAIRPYMTSDLANCPTLSQRFGTYVSVNGGYFGGTAPVSAVIYPLLLKAQNISTLTRNSMSYPVMRSLFSVQKDGTMGVNWIYHFGSTINDIYSYDAPMSYVYNDPTPKAAPTAAQGHKMTNLLVGVGGAPVLVKNGQKHITYNEELMWGSGVGTDPDPRTAIGYTANKHVIMVVADGRMTQSAGFSLDELADVFIYLGCVEAMNLDGGGSSQIAVGSTPLNIEYSRALPVIFSVVNKDSLNLPVDPLFEKIIDTGDPDASSVGANWTTSANSGFWGTTASKICPKGDGSSYYTFKTKLNKKAKYQIQAWWVSANNRGKDTPFIITHNNLTDTVKVDQTINGSQWVKIGEYDFNGDTTEQVVITNKATAGDYVVADAIRLISFDSLALDVKEEFANNISSFELMQNYPNPFNPNTVINYNLPKDSYVTLKVFDVLGNEVKTLVAGDIKQGAHSVNFTANNLSSGIYFYRLNTNSYCMTKKMILIK